LGAFLLKTIDMHIKIIKGMRSCIEHNIKLFNLQLETDYFLVKESREAVEAAVKMNEMLIESLNDEIEAKRLMNDIG